MAKIGTGETENSNVFGPDRVYQFLFLGLAAGFHCLAFFQFQIIPLPSYEGFYYWEYQFFFLICLSLLCSVLAVLVNNAAFRAFFLLSQFLAVQILGIPLGDNLQIEVTLLLNVLFFTGSLFPFPANGLLCFFQIAISSALQKVGYVFELRLPEIPPPDLISFTLVLAFAGFLSCVYGIQKSRINNQKERIVYLKSALSKISQINIGFQKYAVQAGRKTIVTERKRLSREIHDSIGYILTNVLMMVKTSILLAPPSESSLKALLTKISLHAEEGIVEIRSTLHELRNQKFASEHGIMAITKLVKVFSDATGIKVDIEYGNTGNGFTPVIELFIYRMCQEGMLNAFKHGSASYIRILFWRTDTHIHVSIFDNGKSSGVFTKGIGLRGMEERARRLGGEVRILTNSSGFELLALIPFKKETGDYE